MTKKEALKLIKDLIDEYDGACDEAGEPLQKPSREEYDELVTEIYGICEDVLGEGAQ